MRYLRMIIIVIFLTAVLSVPSFANDVEWIDGHHEIGTGKEYFSITNLITRNDVTVTMYEGGGVSYFRMYDNSELLMYDSSINYLYLYDNAVISLLGGYFPGEFYIDPASTALVKLYAYSTNFNPSYPPTEGTLQGYWIANDNPFSIDFVGEGAISSQHIQIVPEPASALILTIGTGLIVSRRRRKR